MIRPNDQHSTLDHLFRNEYGKVVASLTHKFGVSHIEKVEDAVQDAFLKAMQVWGYRSVPENPTGWLLRVASNKLIDGFRKGKKMSFSRDGSLHSETKDSNHYEDFLENEINDSQLKMIFACCHPTLSKEHQIILSLKLIGGFSNKEIAEALLKKEETVAKSFTRAKKKFKEEVKSLTIPIEMALQSRLFVVLRVIYLLFSEGYTATTGAQVIKRDICYEAIRLALMLNENKYTQHPDLHALIALMAFHASRFDARIDEDLEIVDLAHQDRSKYNRELIAIAVFHLKRAGATKQALSNYHLEAAVSYYHCIATTFEETDWESILKLYDIQLKRFYSPVVQLNRIIPFQKVYGAKKASKELKEYRESPHFKEHALYYAVKAEIFKELLDLKEAEDALQKAIALTANEIEKKNLQKKLKNIEKKE